MKGRRAPSSVSLGDEKKGTSSKAIARKAFSASKIHNLLVREIYLQLNYWRIRKWTRGCTSAVSIQPNSEALYATYVFHFECLGIPDRPDRPRTKTLDSYT